MGTSVWVRGNTAHLCSEDAQPKSQPETDNLDLDILWISSVSRGTCWNLYLKLDHDCFVPHLFQFSVHCLPVV
jgi:hypothetical protein